MKKVLIAIAEGFEEMEAIISIDMLHRGGLDVTTASVTDSNIIEGSRKIKIQTNILLGNFKELPDAIVLPGGMPGAENLAKSEKVKELLKNMNNQNKLIAAICASPAIVLAPIGLLDDKKATCYPGFQKNFTLSTTYTNENVVISKNIITSKGPGTAFYFALEIIKYLVGKEKMDDVRQKTLVE